MTVIAILRHWNDEDRRAGSAWIDIINANGDNRTETVTVARRQSARDALAAAGWKSTSGVRLDRDGDPACLVEPLPRPGLAAAQRRVSLLIVGALGNLDGLPTQATDPRNRAAMEDTDRYLGERRDN